MIKKIVMKNCAPYELAELSDCKQINFIYGANGAGKSSISKYLSQLDNPSTRFIDCQVEPENSIKEQIIVYNKDFRQKNFKQDIPGIFTLGQNNIEETNAIEEAKKELENKQNALTGYDIKLKKIYEDLASKEEIFKGKIWEEIYKKHQTKYSKAFEKIHTKNKLYTFLIQLVENNNIAEMSICSEEDLLKRYKSLVSANSIKYQLIEFETNNYLKEIESIESSEIWDTIIVGSDDIDIGKLIKELNISSWVRQGQKILQDSSHICPFCQQRTITDDFRHKLELFFNEEYENNISIIKNFKEKYVNNSNAIINFLDSIIKNDTLVEISGIDISILKLHLATITELVHSNILKMEKKIITPSIQITIKELHNNISEVIKIVDNANKNIEHHNKLIENSTIETQKLIEDIWNSFVYEKKDLIESFIKERNGLNTAIQNLNRKIEEDKKKVTDLEELINEKNKNIISIQSSINEINTLLNNFGFTNFKIVSAENSKNCYSIQRDNGEVATDTLSEGEETFLTFLYFMQLTKGAFSSNDLSKNKIVIIDDPISSLDSNVLYIVSLLIKNLCKDIRNFKGSVKQLFVFTHNVFFFKEASYIDGRTKILNEVGYWIIKKHNNKSTIDSHGINNPISTTYELLWKELRDDDNINVINIQNIMRRIIEYYFGILGGKPDEEIIEYFKTPELKTICKSLVCWINDGSHSIYDDINIDSYNGDIENYKEVFKQIFIQSGNQGHYSMMMKR